MTSETRPQPPESAAPATASERALFDVLAELRKFSRRVRREWGEQVPEITFAESVLLSTVRDQDDLTSMDLARIIGVDKSTISRSISTLEQRGLITRESIPGERRAQKLTITPEAESILVKERQTRLRTLRERLDGWEPEDVARFVEYLHRFNEPLDPQASSTPSR